MRPDGRSKGGSLRPLSCELSPLQRSDGSALWKAGSTQVLAAVYGPIAPQKMSLEKNHAILSILYTPSSGKGSYANNSIIDTSQLETILEGCICIEEYSRCVIEIVIQPIHDDGSLMSCALHAIVAALMDAGISMNKLPVATTIMVIIRNNATEEDNNYSLVLDPDQEEEEQQQNNKDNNTSSVVLTLISSNANPERLLGSNTTATNGSSSLSLKHILACQEAASKATPAVIAFMRMAIEQKVIRQSKTLLAEN